VLSPTKIFAIANQKGGVGKTTTVINLGAYLGTLGERILLVDCDAQANATRSITPATTPIASLYDVLFEEWPIAEAIVPTTTTNVDLLPSAPDLAGAELELLDLPEREKVLRIALADIVDRYRYILLDCPPSLGLMTINALVAAEAVIVPIQCEYLALEGLARLMDTINRIRAGLNPALHIFGLLMTMYDTRTALSQQVAAEVRHHYPELTFETIIPRSVRLGEAPSFGRPILDYDPLSRGAQAYQALATEVARRG
jgi:chromosome partitioning protein